MDNNDADEIYARLKTIDDTEEKLVELSKNEMYAVA